MRPADGAGVTDHRYQPRTVGVEALVIDRLDRHLVDGTCPDQGLEVGGECGGDQMVEVAIEIGGDLPGGMEVGEAKSIPAGGSV